MWKYLISFLLIPSLAFGAASYPTSVKSFTTKVDNVDDVMAEDINGLQDEVVAIQTALGTGLTNPVVQVVNVQSGALASGTTVMPVDDTIPQNSEGDEFLTLAITPKSATNILKIDVQLMLANSSGSNYMSVALFQDTTAGALAATSEMFTASGNVPMVRSLTYYMIAGTTSAKTFKVRAGCQTASTTYLNAIATARVFGGVSASSITITELKA
jgi:hypothetical protein